MQVNLVAETPALRKKCSKVRSAAGPRIARLLKEIAKRKKKSASNIGYVDAPVLPVPGAPEAAPAAALPDGGGAADPPPVEDIPCSALQPSH